MGATPDTRAALFAGGGRVGADMAAVDWSTTPLGEPDSWPTPLRTVVQMLLTSRFSMWMAWGPELTVFYNDAYWRDTLQSKHPWALGKPAHVMWSEIWPDIGPRIASVLDTGAATWDEDLLLFLERSGYPEETYHTFSYSPLADTDGAIAGMLCVVTENTDRVIGERRMATLRDLATAMAPTRSRDEVLGAVEQTLAANDRDVPFGLLYLVDPATGTAHLAARAGITPGAPGAPEVIAPGHGPWPLADLEPGEPVLLDDVPARVGGELPRGAWDRGPTEAVLVPLAAAPGTDGLGGVLVVGMNPHRRYDERAASFLQLLGGQITAGLAHADGYEAERRRAEALAELDRAKTDFFSNVSHEFRTPLTLIMGPVEDLRATDHVEPERWRAELEVVHRNGQRLGRMVNSLLDFSRLEAGRRETHPVPVDLGPATEELAGVFRSAMARAGLEYVVDCPPLHRPVLLDRDAWEKVVLNLLSNALKFTLSGGVRVTVEAADDDAVLRVADTGVGVPPDQLPRLFERFHRVQSARARSGEGSGIGLALVRELVALHGGDVSAQSTPGVGTTMTVTIPFAPADVGLGEVDDAEAVEGPSLDAASFVAEALRWLPDEEPPADEPPAGGLSAEEPATGGDPPPAAVEALDDPAPAAERGRVLVVDDNADMRTYLRRLLAPRHDVRVAADGETALAAAFADPPDLVVSDVMMPGVDGLELLAALRADERTARVPVLLLSARAGQEAALEGLAAQADDYLVKPFAPLELRARVDAHLQLGRARRRAEARFTAMADLAPALIWVASADGARTFHNAGWRRYTGRDATQELGDAWRAGLHPDDREHHRAVTATAMAEGHGWEVDYRLRRADGVYHRVVEQAVPLPGDGGPSGWVGSCVDVNDRALEAERQRLLARVGAELDREPEVAARLERLLHLLVEVRLAARAVARPVDEEAHAGTGRVAERVDGADGPDGPDGGGAVISRVRAGRPLPAEPLRESEREALAQGAAVTVDGVLSLPLTVRDRPVAVLSLERGPEGPEWSDEDRDLVAEIGGRAALALDNALLLAEERSVAARLQLLQRATSELSAAATPVEVADVTVEHLRALFGPTARVAVFEYEPRARTLAPLAAHNVDPPVVVADPASPTMVGAAIGRGEALWMVGGADGHGEHEGHDGARDAPLRALMADSGVLGSMALPLVAAGTTVGALGIGLLDRDRVSRTERVTLEALAEPCAMALDRARLYRGEHQIAETLQRSLLPQALPALDGISLAVRYLPGAAGTQAGGDWYDVVELDEHRIAIAVGDVVGQGTAAAAVMGQLRTALSGYILAGHGPAAALGLLDGLTSRIPGSRASTAMCVTLDTRTGELRWARAGHLPALLIEGSADGGGGEVRYLDDPAGHGPLLGLPPGHRDHGEAVTTLADGGVLLLYTDGLVERRGESLDEGYARLKEAVERYRGAPPEPLAGALLRDLGPRDDDVALVVARLSPPPLELALPARPDSLALLRRRVSRWARAAGLPELAYEDLQLALGEAATNGVEHAYRDAGDHAGEVEVRVARCGDGSVEAAVRDRGTWRPVPHDPGYRGRGLTIVRELTVDTAVTPREGGGTEVRFRILPSELEEPPAAPGPADGEPVPPPGTPVRLDVVEDGGRRRLVLRGDLDLAAVATCREGLFDALEDAALVEIDLRAVGHLASAGVGLVLEAVQTVRARGGEVAVRTAPGTPPARVLAVAMPDDGAGSGP